MVYEVTRAFPALFLEPEVRHEKTSYFPETHFFNIQICVLQFTSYAL